MKYLTPSGLLQLILQVAAVMFLILVVLNLCVWLLERIWLWVLGAAFIVGVTWLLVRWRRRRNSQWW